MNLDNKMVIDHIDFNTLNNRKNNLRVCEKRCNDLHRRTGKFNKSGHIGVMWYPYDNVNKWLAYIKVNYKWKNLGYYNTFEEACLKRQEAELKYFGDYANKENKYLISNTANIS